MNARRPGITRQLYYLTSNLRPHGRAMENWKVKLVLGHAHGRAVAPKAV